MKNIHIVLVLIIVFVAIVSVMVWHLSRLQTNLIHSTALRTAELYSIALTEFRSLYTSEVVAKVKGHGLDITHDYASSDEAIPLPATLSMKLGEQIGKRASGAKADLYSPYPFPWRKREKSGQFFKFQNDAWKYLLKHPNQSYYRFERDGVNSMLRYATADTMRPQCIHCHNTHPDSPKQDWKIGDLRGVLAINVPLDSIVAHTEMDLKSTSYAYFAIGAGIALAIAMVIVKLRQQSQTLQFRVEERTAELESEIKERHRAMETLTESEEQNRLLLNSAAEGIYGIDLNDKTTFVNPAACRMLGYNVEELLGQSMHTLVHHSYADGSPYLRENCPMYAAITEGQVRRVENEVLWRKDGSQFPVEYTSTPLLKHEKLVGAVVIFNDVSERKKVDRMKDEFISTVSHELRTPLTSIKGALGLIVGGKFDSHPDKIHSMLNIAYENSNRLSLLIDDILDFNKLEAEKTLFQMNTIHINSLIEKTILAIQGYADRYSIQLQWQNTESDNVVINGDENRLIQVLTNLLSNAIKHSPKGEQVGILSNYDDKEVRISITDNGPGIQLEFQDRIFEKFTQEDSSDTRQVGGTGLGLAITKEIIEKHGGSIGFHSTPGQGSTFYFDLPIAKSPTTGITI